MLRTVVNPARSVTLAFFAPMMAARGADIPRPIPLDRFVEYGLWFQRRAVPEIDRRRIARIEQESNGFQLTLSDGERIHSRRVVVAAGIGPFARRPKLFEELPSELVTHASDRSDVRRFARKRVVVIGAGQSALESAALIHEAGGAVEEPLRSDLQQHFAAIVRIFLHHRIVVTGDVNAVFLIENAAVRRTRSGLKIPECVDQITVGIIFENRRRRRGD